MKKTINRLLQISDLYDRLNEEWRKTGYSENNKVFRTGNKVYVQIQKRYLNNSNSKDKK